jgi:two-component system NtrC family sensor kinase
MTRRANTRRSSAVAAKTRGVTMKLAFKLAAVFLLAVTLLGVAHVYYRIEHESVLFREQTLAEIYKLADALDDKVLERMLTEDPEDEILLVAGENDEQGRIITRLVELTGARDHIGDPWAARTLLTPTMIAEHEFVQTRGDDGTFHLTAYWEITVVERPPVFLEFSRPMLALDREKQDAYHRAYWLIGSMVFFTGIVAIGVGVRFVGNPLQQLIEKTQQIAQGKLDEPLKLNTHDELSDLADSLNGMCDELSDSRRAVEQETTARLAALEQLRHSDRLQTVGRLASGMAHELGTPLNVVAGRANLIASGKLGGEEITESAEAIKLQANRMTQIIRQLLDFARRGAPSRIDVDLCELVGQTAHMLSSLATKQNVEIVSPEGAKAVPAHVDAGQMQQVLTNLIVNAIQAMPRGGTIHLDVYAKRTRRPNVTGQSEYEYHCIDVQDDGDGIEAAGLVKLFEPFFTTKGAGEGTGLGLSIAQGIVEEHGGWIEVRSAPGEGACFTIYLPVEVAS